MGDVDAAHIKLQVEGTELAFKGIDATIQRARDTISMAAWGVALAAPAFIGLVSNFGRVRVCSIFEPYTLTVVYQVAFSTLVVSVVCAFVNHLLVYGFLDTTLRNKEATYRGLAIVVVNTHRLATEETAVGAKVDEARDLQVKTIDELRRWARRLRCGGKLFAAQQLLLILGYVLGGVFFAFLDPAKQGCS